jgi:hypothetical protein
MGVAPVDEPTVLVDRDLCLAANRDALLRFLAACFAFRYEILIGTSYTGKCKQHRTEHKGGRFHGR